MNRPQMKDNSAISLIPAAARRPWCVLVAFGLLIPIVFGNDFGLINPAEKEFTEFQPETRAAGELAKKSPAFTDRSLSIPQTTEMTRQVSASVFGDDPFPEATQPMATQPSVFDWGTVTSAVPNSPNAGVGYADPYAAMQNIYPHTAYPAGMEMQGFFPQPAQFPQQYQQGYMIDGVDPSMNFHAHMYPQYGNFGDPYAVNYQAGYQEVPDYSAIYQALMFQEMMRRQAEEADKESKAEEARKQANDNWTLNNLMPVRVTSPLGETMLACAKTVSPFSSPSGPDKGVGMPLVGKSWLDHPYYFGGFVGQISGTQLVSKMINQKSGGHGGLILGYNYNDYWGLESRLHFSSIDIYDTDYAKQMIAELYPEATVLPTTRTNELSVLDVSVQYYPLGNAKWRPYFKYGLGMGQQKYVNSFGGRESSSVMTMPLGGGLRYWWNERLAIQMDLLDNVIFASKNAKTQNNVAFTIGLTYAFGTGRTKHPVHHWPYTPSMGSKW